MNGDTHPSSPTKTYEDIVNGNVIHEETSFGSSDVRRPRTNSSPGHRHQLSGSLSGNGPSQSFHYPNPPPSAGPHRTGFHTSQAPPPSSPFNSNFQFGRPSPSASSPMSHSFSTPTAATTVLEHDNGAPYSNPSSPVSSQNHIGKQQRHTRIHSRNLSLYFPRPGTAGAQPSISEDGAQEVEAPVMTMLPSASNGSAQSHTPNGSKRLGEGFTFGKPGTGGSPISPGAGGPSTRKGHHHKHSLSHNFFSFLDPTAMTGPASSTPAAVSTSFPSASSPLSPWAPISPFTATTPSHLQPAAIITSSTGSLPSPSTQASSSMLSSLFALPTGIQHALLFTIAEFALGASVWAVGQHNGTIGCAGLGYWVVFDAVGVGLTVYSRMLRFGERTSIRKPYGSQRTETVSLFAQSIYLLFSAVYVCKETVEHVLLSAGSGHHGHGHHPEGQGQRAVGIAYPTILIWLSAILLLTSRILYKTHSKLVDATGNYIPSLSSILHPPGHSATRFVQPHLLANPFTSAPLLFCFVLLFISYVVSPGQHRYADLVLSGIETLVTFSVAYPAVVTLAQVLCQTAPERGLPGAQMEAFLRVMRELERHPHVLHLPAPHLWQLTPPSQSTFPARKEREEGELNSSSLVATVELHVRKDLPDNDVLQLTRWAWERCSSALGQGAEAVTIGIVRG